MATLSPFGFLLIFLGIQLAPSSATQIMIQMDQYNRIILEKQNSGEWKRIDNDVVVPVSFKVEQTKLFAKGNNDKTESVDLAEHYKIKGDENWSDLKEIPAKAGPAVKLIRQDRKLIVETQFQDQKFQSEITWVLKKEKE
jgi:hypothetical protein